MTEGKLGGYCANCGKHMDIIGFCSEQCKSDFHDTMVVGKEASDAIDKLHSLKHVQSHQSARPIKLCILGSPTNFEIGWVKAFCNDFVVHFITTKRLNLELLRDEMVSGKVIVHRLRNIPKLNLFINPRRVRRLIHQINPDIIHAIQATPWGHYASGCSLPYIVTCLGSDITTAPKNRLLRRFVKKALTNAALIHVTGETPKRIVERLAPLDCQVKVQYWGVDLDAFQPHPKPRSPKSFTIGTASSLEKIYGIDRIILAFSRLVDVVTQEQNVMNLPKPDIRLRIAGDGPEMQYLSLMADDLGISDRVDFIGREKHEFMPSFYNSLDLYVSAFTDDRAGSAFGVSATEAMACGIPLLIERRADTEELLSDLAFIMYKGDNELTDQMIALYDSAERRAALATRGRMLAEKSFDWRKNMANWKAIYDEWTKLYINADNHMTE